MYLYTSNNILFGTKYNIQKTFNFLFIVIIYIMDLNCKK